jgi:hypothetical protein
LTPSRNVKRRTTTEPARTSDCTGVARLAGGVGGDLCFTLMRTRCHSI